MGYYWFYARTREEAMKCRNWSCGAMFGFFFFAALIMILNMIAELVL